MEGNLCKQDVVLHKWKKLSTDVIDRKYELLFGLSRELWARPELGFEEHFAHATITSILEQEGFSVRRNYPLQTSFVARFGAENGKGFKIGICCEYDALPKIGHACGHNLIAEAGVAAALGIRAVLEAAKFEFDELVVIGTPAEEDCCGGKEHLIKAGVFDDLDICMMVHPFTHDVLAPGILSLVGINITYRGSLSANPLDAAVALYSNASLLRQQMKPSCRIHGVFTRSGTWPDVIPEVASVYYMIRGPTDKERDELKDKFLACAQGAATATGCSIEIEDGHIPYSAMKHNTQLLKLYSENLVKLGIVIKDVDVAHGSTDMGNVSHVVPSIHPKFKIPSSAPTHTEGFTVASGLEGAQLPTLNAAKALAMTAIDVLVDRSILIKIKEEFAAD